MKDSSSYMSRLIYKIGGPSTVHLEYEICLLVTSMCLTGASLVSLYKTSFGSSGDFFYLLVSNIWLARHFLHRLICTTDVGTSIHLSKSPMQTLRWSWIAITSGGQSFDIPTNMLTASSSSYNYIDNFVPHKSGSTRDFASTPTTILITSAPFIFQVGIIKPLAFIWTIFKMIKAAIRPKSSKYADLDEEDWVNSMSSTNNSSNSNNSSFRKDDHDVNTKSFSYIYEKSKKKFQIKFQLWWQYMPPLQFLTLLSFVCLTCWFCLKYMDAQSSYNIPFRKGKNTIFDQNMGNTRVNGVNTRFGANNVKPNLPMDVKLNGDFMNKKFDLIQSGKYAVLTGARDFVYSWLGMICAVFILGTIGSFLLYGRLMPPLPDLVSGVNVKGSHKSSKPSNYQKQWSESYKSITSEDKFILHFKVLSLRIVEYLILCVLLPRSEYVCKVSGHCPINPLLSETGHASLIGAKGTRAYENLMFDPFLGILITFTVFISTFFILLSQIIITDKSALALKSYSQQMPQVSKKSSMRKAGNKNDFGMDYGGQSTNTSNRGLPMEIKTFKTRLERKGLELLSNELGALSTSHILSVCARFHMIYTTFIIAVWIYYAVMSGEDWFCFILIYAALFSSAVEVGYLEKNSLYKISGEIFSSNMEQKKTN